MKPYCPACLDVWAITPAIIASSNWHALPLNASMHVACGRALEKLHTGLASFESEPPRPRWAA